jgi:hypothetical protein
MKYLMFFLVVFSLNTSFGKGSLELGKVEGSIYNAISQEVMTQVEVKLFNAIDGTINEVKTNDNGKFKIDGLPYGEYILSIDIDGYQKTTVYNVIVMKENPIERIARIELITNSVSEIGNVKGSVYNSSFNEDLEYAAITIYSSLDNSLFGVGVTNGEGEFNIENLPFGEYYLTISYVGFENVTVYNIVLMDKEPNVNIKRIEMIPKKVKESVDLYF